MLLIDLEHVVEANRNIGEPILSLWKTPQLNIHEIAHQAETVAQLRREANQWKDQSRNWQEHFLRVEQERCALSSRVDELVAERLQVNPILLVPPFTQLTRA